MRATSSPASKAGNPYRRAWAGSDAEVAELADAQDLKSCGPHGPCGFDPHPRHFVFSGLRVWSDDRVLRDFSNCPRNCPCGEKFSVPDDVLVLSGVIEVVDGRWGASLEINPEPPEEDEDEEAAERRRPVPLLLYDLWNDPMALCGACTRNGRTSSRSTPPSWRSSSRPTWPWRSSSRRARSRRSPLSNSGRCGRWVISGRD